MSEDERRDPTELMRATYRALCKHRSASSTMPEIAEKSSKGKASLHYSFDGKRDLLVSFPDFPGETAEFSSPPSTARRRDGSRSVTTQTRQMIDDPVETTVVSDESPRRTEVRAE
ncbi:TetR family transcriptional regulator [Haloprofundus salilacus]|uniref:TetR family transcriptional regulator n=1 Tax=Haloprofundus salilacus TaxID=2876190 RepID=UPI001CCBE1C6|nr:TetR family transcriptional regulator [Haloprofundus salilacus]